MSYSSRDRTCMPPSGGGPPGRGSPGCCAEPGVEELVERLGRVLLGVAGPHVVAGRRVSAGEAGREERVGGERVKTAVDRVAFRPRRVQEFVDGDVEDSAGVVADIGEEAGTGDADAVRRGPAQHNSTALASKQTAVWR